MKPWIAPDPIWENEKDALRVLDLIVAEFNSDLMSVQCFDLRIVERAKKVIADRRDFERLNMVPPMLTASVAS